MDDEIFLDKLANSLFDFLIIARNNLMNSDEFLKNFPIQQKKFEEYLQKYPMPPSHIKVIIYLARVNSASISQIASTLNISKSNMTPIIDKLISYGLVNRYTDEKDRRILRIELTELAFKLFNSFKVYAKSTLLNKISILSDDDLKETQDCIEKLTSIFLKLS